MGFDTHLRTLVSTTALAVLLIALSSAGMIACGDVVASQPDKCCNTDGSCKYAPDDDSSGCCLKARSIELPVIEQSRLISVAACLPLAGPADVLMPRPAAGNVCRTAQYSPPDLYLLNSTFLI